jgi:twitching motility protein PilT
LKDIVDTGPIDLLLRQVVDAGASDLMITAGSRPRMRIDGDLIEIESEPVLSADEASDLIMSLLADHARSSLRELKEIDLAFAWQNQIRFRANIFLQQGEPAMALRLIPGHIPTLSDLGLPGPVESFCGLPQGLVLMTGPTGSGKSTTLAAMIDWINERRPCHILTIEDPIEYVHRHKRAVVNQREVGIDTDSFDRALRAALREDPDVILVGEMRDVETIQFVLSAAETGHLVFATMHTNDAAQAIDRVVDVFPVDRQMQVRVQLSACLSGVISQRLLPRVDGGMVAAYEVLVATGAIRNVIREGKSHQLRNLVSQGAREGMQTLERSLSDLVTAGTIRYEDALARAVHPRDLNPSGPSGALKR